MELMERTMLLKSVICQGGYVMPGVCLSVCLSISNVTEWISVKLFPRCICGQEDGVDGKNNAVEVSYLSMRLCNARRLFVCLSVC